MGEHKERLIEMLEEMNRAYVARDQQNVVPLEQRLFASSGVHIIIGTCNDEWCFGTERVRKIFSTDWSSWGGLTIDIPTLVCEEKEPFLWFYVKAELQYKYKTEADLYNATVALTEQLMGRDRPAADKCRETAAMLTRILSVSKKAENEIVWELTLSGMMRICNGDPRFETMQFSIPQRIGSADVRTDLHAQYGLAFDRECGKIREYIEKNRERVSSAQSERLAADFVSGRFSLVEDQKKRFLGVEGTPQTGSAFRLSMKEQREAGNQLQLLPENIITVSEGNEFFFCGAGMFVRGKETEPFRIEGMGKLAEQEPVLSYVQISYPFNGQWDACWCDGLDLP